MLYICFLLLIGLFIVNYILVIIIIVSDVSDSKIKRLEGLQVIKTKKQLLLYLIPYYYITYFAVDSLFYIINEFIDFYRKLK